MRQAVCDRSLHCTPIDVKTPAGDRSAEYTYQHLPTANEAHGNTLRAAPSTMESPPFTLYPTPHSTYLQTQKQAHVLNPMFEWQRVHS